MITFHLNFAALRLRMKQFFVPGCKRCRNNGIGALPSMNSDEPKIDWIVFEMALFGSSNAFGIRHFSE
jgi:hypothetical protein